MINQLEERVLQAIFALSQATRPIDAGALSRMVGVSVTDVGAALVRLEEAGLIDASRARLTMLGLARACQLGAGRGGTPLDLEAAAPAPMAQGPAPLAAQATADGGLAGNRPGNNPGNNPGNKLAHAEDSDTDGTDVSGGAAVLPADSKQAPLLGQ